jgi:23S rRNA maturation mini-RNase III
MTITLLGPSMRLANEAIAKRIVAKVRDHSQAPGLLTLDRWELAEREIRLALDAAGRGRNANRPTAAG